MEKKSIYDQQVFDSTLERIERLTPETSPQWGKMDAAQMMSHNTEILNVFNGKPLLNTPFIAKLFKGMIRKMVVGEKPYPKNSKTHPQYLQTSAKDFDAEKQNLLNVLHKTREMEGEKTEHALFGVLNTDEKGWSLYKHLDHHLTQFGV